MRFVTYVHKGVEQPGIVTDQDRVVPLTSLPGSFASNTAEQSLLAFIKTVDNATISALKESLANSSDQTSVALSEVHLQAPIPYPQRDIICLGKNYKQHAEEVADQIKSSAEGESHPIYFSKSAFPAIGPDTEVDPHTDVTSQLDYEVELGVIIGKNGSNIQPEQVQEYIFGYTIINDVSARDVQIAHQQWYRGKSMATFCPMGPWIVHTSQIPFPVHLAISCSINGEQRQSSNTSKMIYDIPFVISQLSQSMQLHAGDIIATGTPEGVGMGFKPPRYLSPGDEMVCTIEKIGELRNRIKAS